MSLSGPQAIEAARNPPNADQVARGRTYQSKLRVLTLPLERHDLDNETGWTSLLNDLKAKLTAEKYNAIVKYFTYPLSVVMMSNDMMLDLYKVFDGRNANYSVDYDNDRAKDMGKEVLGQLNVLDWIKTTGKGVLKCAPNTVVVIDKNEDGDPILLPVSNEKLRGYKFNKDGSFDFVVFVHSKGITNDKPWTKYAVYDDEFYRVIADNGGHYSEEFANPHTLRSCPARFFYDNPLVDKHKFARSIPIGNAKGVMNQWTIIDLYNYYTDNYAAYQVTQYHDAGCDFDCTEGIIYVSPVLDDDNKVSVEGFNKECPHCSKKGLMGPGSAIGVELGVDKDDQDARDIFKYIAPNILPLEYTQKKQDGRERNIKENIVGYSDAITSDAINETQVKALVESRKKPLFDIKFHLENLYKWITESSIKLTLDVKARANANYGTEFFILTTSDIQELIIQAKAAGTQATYIEQLNRLLISTEYKGDPNLVERMLITADVQPQPFATQEETRQLFGENMMTREDYYWHSNFTDLLTEFELTENTNIVSFGSDLMYSEKIKAIKDIFLHLIKEKLPEDEQQDDNAQPTATSDTRVEQR